MDPHGRTADAPTEVPARGWKDILARVRAEAKCDNVSLLSAGVAFYSLLALVPAMIAGIGIYGLIADPAEVESQVVDALRAAPREVREMVASQMESIASSSGGALVATIIGIAVAIWSASSGVGKLMSAINVAYDEDETRGWLKVKLTALAFTLGAVLFFAVALAIIAVLPALLANANIGVVGRVIAEVLRWVLLLGAMMLGLAILYRYAPARDNPKWRWVSAGAVLAGVLWVVGSIGFSIYTANFGKYNETYGSLGAIVVVMLWLFLTAASVIMGAELNAEIERQTAIDTTEGRPRPLGARNANAADTIGATAEEVKAAKVHGPAAASAVATGEVSPQRAADATRPRRSGGERVVAANGSHGAVGDGGSGSPGAIPAAVGLSVLGVALKVGRKLLERGGATSRS